MIILDQLDKVYAFLKTRLYKRKKRRLLRVMTTTYNVTKYGNDYGGFYVYDDSLRRSSHTIVYSFGIGTDLSFSEAILEKLRGAIIYAFDPTPKSIDYVKNHSLNSNPRFRFCSFGLSDVDGTEKFYLPRNDNYVSGSIEHRGDLNNEAVIVDMRSLASIAKDNNHSHIDLLKMDIEGSEFKVIESFRNCNVTIDQICVEIHDRFFADGLQRLGKMLQTLRSLGYILISVSEGLDEVTFIKSR